MRVVKRSTSLYNAILQIQAVQIQWSTATKLLNVHKMELSIGNIKMKSHSLRRYG